VVIGGLITFATNYLMEGRKYKNEERKRQQDEEAKKLNLRYQAYINFLSTTIYDVHPHDENDYEYFDSGLINDISASVITYGSPRVSSLLAKSFPLKSWEEIEAIKKKITGELVLEKGGISPSEVGLIHRDHNGKVIPPEEEAKKRGWWQFWN
jgi:hypothetical protein